MKRQPLDNSPIVSKWFIPGVLFCAAVLIRLAYLWSLGSFPLLSHPVMDEHYHVVLAHQILDGGLPAEPFYRAPLYPYFLALLFTLTGGDLFVVRVIQVVLGATIPPLVYLVGLRLFNRSVALGAAIAAVFYPTLIYYDAQLLITSLMVLLTLLLTWQLLRTEESGQRHDFILAGLLLGLAGLARPNILLLGPALAIWGVLVLRPRFGWRGAAVRYALLGLAACVVVAPVTIRNAVVGGEPVLIAWQGGFNFYLGNNRDASGWAAVAPGIDQSWMGGYLQAIAIAEDDAGRPLSRSEVSDYWYDRGWDEIRQSPEHFVGLVFRKLLLFGNGYEIPNNQDIYLHQQHSAVLKPLMWKSPFYFPYGLLAPFALLGLFFTLKAWRRYLLVYLILSAYTLSLLLFFVCARYRQPLIPLLLLLAAYAVWRVVQWIRKREYKTVGLVAVILIPLLVTANYDMVRLDPAFMAAENHFTLGKAYYEQGDVPKAIAELKEAVAAHPAHAPSHNTLGKIFVELGGRGNRLTAAQHFRLGIRSNPEIVESFYNLATIYLEENDLRSAIQVLEEGRRLHPYDDYLHLKLAMTYFEAGDLQRAEAYLQQSLRLNPNSQAARSFEAQLRAAAQRPPG